jgi:DNA topoisomerase-1
MVLRSGKFGKYISSVNYPTVKFVVRLDKKDQIILPTAPPMQDPAVNCSKCGKVCNIRDGKRGMWLGCSGFPKCRGRGDLKVLDEARVLELKAALAAHTLTNAPAQICRRDGTAIAAGTAARDLILPESVVVLPIHPEPIPTDAGVLSPYRAAEIIAKPFVEELLLAAKKRKANTPIETE